MGERSFDYSIDREDKVAAVSESWLEFARANRARELTCDHVLGRSLWSFIAGRETRTLYETLFRKLRRTAETIELPFRCDSPDRFRFMRLALALGPSDSIHCQGVLIREQQRPFYSILDRAFPRNEDSLSMCSLCKKVFAFETKWLELEDAIREMDLFHSRSLPEIRYGLCDGCASLGQRTQGGTAAA